MRLNSILAFILCLSSVVNAQALGAFYTLTGPTIVAQDPSTGKFVYNVDSAKGFSAMQTLSVNTVPKNGTAIASAGYSNGMSIYGSIFYQNTNNGLSWLFFKCAYASGMCVNYGERNISTNVSTPVSPNTGLSAALLATNDGYRVTYEDINGAVRQLSYANSTKGVITPWADGTPVANYTVSDGYALSTIYTVGSNVTAYTETVFQIYNGQILPCNVVVDNITNSISDNVTWTATNLIGGLTNWNPSNASIATIHFNEWDCIFYIDTTRHLQFLRSTNGGNTWAYQPQQGNTTIWPLADEPNAPIAAAASINSSDPSASVFYTSGQKLVQLRTTSSTWYPATIVEAPPLKASVSTKPRNTKDIKIGIATGASVMFIGIVVTVVWYFRRKKSAAATTEKTESTVGWEGNGSSQYGYSGKPELDGRPVTFSELDHDPECLLLHQLQQIRLHELRAGIPVELQGKALTGHELDGSLCRCEMDASERHELPTGFETDDDSVISRRGSNTTSRKGKEKEVSVTTKELPSWSWRILKRLKEEQEERQKQTKEEKDDPENGEPSDGRTKMNMSFLSDPKSEL